MSVVVYTQMMCGYCSSAKKLLKSKGVEFTEIDVTFKPSVRKDMTEKAGGKTSTPQIFIGETHVGGCDELYAMEDDGKLDPLLQAEGITK